MKNKLSVIIITYNMGRLIGTALDSLVNQTRKDFDVIVVDNHSTDDTVQVTGKYSQLSIDVLEIHNEGILSKSRNLGVSKAKGEWVAFLDADDYWEREKVEELYRHINSVSEECVAISHRCYEKDLQKHTWKEMEVSFDHENLSKFLIINKNPFCLSGTAVRKASLLSVGGFSENPAYKTVEDYELWIRLSIAGSFVYIEKPLATIVLHEGNYSKKADIQMNALHTMKMEYLKLYSSMMSEDEKKSALKLLYELEARCLQKNGFYKDGLKKCREARNYKIHSIKLIIIKILCYLEIQK